MRHCDGSVGFAPKLPEQLGRLAFTVQVLQRRLRVEITGPEATYELVDGDTLDIEHYGETVTLKQGAVVTRQVPQIPEAPPVAQPAGRHPAHRGWTPGRHESGAAET
ncbi:glycosyl hydrolase family 65 protein [Streptomyces roseoverticillatus]